MKPVYPLVAGVDEAGRGPLAGPVVASAVILPPDHAIEGLTDSKKLSPARRQALCALIKTRAVAWSVAEVSVAEIDTLNILQASLCAMQRAVAALAVQPHEVLVDGNHCPEFAMSARAIIGGDGLEDCISAASIVAKVTRDAQMGRLDADYPGYDFARHKGYGTKVHLDALAVLGASAIHRRSFAPVARVIALRNGE